MHITEWNLLFSNRQKGQVSQQRRFQTLLKSLEAAWWSRTQARVRTDSYLGTSDMHHCLDSLYVRERTFTSAEFFCCQTLRQALAQSLREFIFRNPRFLQCLLAGTEASIANPPLQRWAYLALGCASSLSLASRKQQHAISQCQAVDSVLSLICRYANFPQQPDRS